MQDAVTARTPVHLWIVGILATLWNAFGCYDYMMTRMSNTDYLASAMPGVDPNALLAWVDAFPFYAQSGWALGVWGGLVGGILLLMRSRWAMWALGVSLLGAVVGLGYQVLLAPPLPGAEGFMMTAMPYIIIAVAAAFFVYARAMVAKGVLR